MPKYKKKSDAIFNCTFLSSTKSFISIDLKGREGSFIHLNHWRPRPKERRSPELKLGLLWVAGLRVPNQHQQLLSGCTPAEGFRRQQGANPGVGLLPCTQRFRNKLWVPVQPSSAEDTVSWGVNHRQ